MGKKIISWVKKNRIEAIILALTLLLGFFLRIYRIDEYMTFLGDEGRDAIVVRRLLVNLDPILIGPRTSIGDMYLGPLYYYLMAPFLLLANFNPAGPAVMVAILGVATIFFIWLIARVWFGKLASFVSSFLYSISPIVIIYSRSSWNPNIMPFFAILCIYSIWRAWFNLDYKMLVVLGISFAFVLQSHYLGLLLLPVLFIFWFWTFLKSRLRKQNLIFIKSSLVSLFLFLLLMSPLVIFDFRHGLRNFSAIKRFFTEREITISARPWAGVHKIQPITTKVVTRLLTATSENFGKLLSLPFLFSILMIALLSILNLIKRKGKINKFQSGYLIISFWLIFALEGLSLYKQEIYDHYYGFFFPAPFLLLGGLAQSILEISKKLCFFKKIPIFISACLLFLILVFVNLQNNPLKYPPNRQLQKTIEVAKKILKENDGQKFNLAVIAERNYEGAYQYFLEVWNAPLLVIDPIKAEETITNTLFVVCELPKQKCDPTHNPKAEIANFGWSKVDKEWEIEGITLYKLVHLNTL